MLLLLTLLSATSTACSRTVNLYPITNEDIMAVKAGEQMTAPRDGLFMSTMYVEKILKARVKSK